jgi:hypothetical protein
MIPNLKYQEAVAILDGIAPISQGAGTVTSGYVSIANFHRLAAVIQTGVLGASATLDGKLQQAQDSGGTGVKDISGKALTQIVKASGDGKQAIIEVADAELDTANGFSYVRLSLTVGTAASLVAATLLGFNARFMPAAALDNATVVQLVG